MSSRPIGIFDSGVGGLTVLKEVEKLLPQENIIYLGDTARVPYGSKSKSTIIKFSTENILFLLRKRVKLVIIACNTASSLALDYLQNIFSIPIIGVINSGVEKALAVTEKERISVIGTKSTIESQRYDKEIHQRNPKIKVFSKACPLFVPLVEQGMFSGKIVDDVISLYLKDIRKSNVDTLILGCTHYPMLKESISKYLKDTYIVDSAYTVANYAKKILSENNLLSRRSKPGRKQFFATDDTKGFMQLAGIFLKRKIGLPREVVNV